MRQPSKKIALITGAGRGIGKAIARKLSADNFYTVLVSRTLSDLERTLEEINETGGEGRIHVCDVSDHRNVIDMVNSLGTIDVLVNNAGRGGGGITCEMEDELWNDIMNTNVNSVYYVTKQILKSKKMNSPGAIINIASTGGKQGVMYAAAYSASKHAIVGFSKALGLELAKQDITVNAVCPGFVETGMASGVRESYSKIWQSTLDETKHRIEQRIPLGRYIQPEEVASMVAFLVSSEARGITAQALNVCGGLGNY